LDGPLGGAPGTVLDIGADHLQEPGYHCTQQLRDRSLENGASLVLKSMFLLKIVGLLFEILRHLQPTFPNGVASSTFSKLAIPGREFTQLLRL
jgi:hypothetical protein